MPSLHQTIPAGDKHEKACSSSCRRETLLLSTLLCEIQPVEKQEPACSTPQQRETLLMPSLSPEIQSRRQPEQACSTPQQRETLLMPFLLKPFSCHSHRGIIKYAVNKPQCLCRQSSFWYCGRQKSKSSDCHQHLHCSVGLVGLPAIFARNFFHGFFCDRRNMAV